MSNLSFVNTLLVAVVGILVVFFGLTILIMLIGLMEKLTGGVGKKKAKEPAKAAAPAPAPAPAGPAPVAAPAPVQQSNDELIAVITAAVAAMMGEGNGFTVRRVRRVTNTPAWAKAGREEQIYSRY